MDLELTAAGFSGVILAGGTAARMDGVDKAASSIGGRTLLGPRVDALLDADEVVVVGDPVSDHPPGDLHPRETRRTADRSPGCSPASTRCCARRRLVGVLAVDMPRVTRVRPCVGCGRRRRDTTAPSSPIRTAAASSRACSTHAVSTQVRPDARGPARDGAAPAARPAGPRACRPIGDEARDIDTWADLRDLRRPSRHGVATTRRGVRDIGTVNLHDWIDELSDVLDVETEVDEA